MNKKILAIGLIMLIIGIAMAAGGTEYFESSFTGSSSTHYYEIRSGLNVSNNITVKSGYIVIIDGAISNSGLVNYSSLASVKNVTALKSVEQKASESDAGLNLFIALKPGVYKYVYFNGTSSVPEYGHITASQFDSMAALILGGGFIGFVGFIIMIYGAIKKQKPKNPYAADDPYNIDNIKI